ncbi:hypothetical protein ACJX0J_018381, partial [Zea mays]
LFFTDVTSYVSRMFHHGQENKHKYLGLPEDENSREKSTKRDLALYFSRKIVETYLGCIKKLENPQNVSVLVFFYNFYIILFCLKIIDMYSAATGHKHRVQGRRLPINRSLYNLNRSRMPGNYAVGV